MKDNTVTIVPLTFHYAPLDLAVPYETRLELQFLQWCVGDDSILDIGRALPGGTDRNGELFPSYFLKRDGSISFAVLLETDADEAFCEERIAYLRGLASFLRCQLEVWIPEVHPKLW